MKKPISDLNTANREAGVCLPIASLPSAYGIGEIGTNAYHFIDQLRAMRLRVWQFLPIGPTGYGNSPYQPLSTFAGNEMLIDIGNLVELGLLEPSEVATLTQLSAEFVDYGALIPMKTACLRAAAARFAATANAELQKEFCSFVAQNDALWLHDYALFRVLKTQHNQQPWPQWHVAYVHRDATALAELEKDAADDISATKIIQFLFYRQWSDLKAYAGRQDVQLFGDMPIYVALDSADAWAKRDLLQIDDAGQPLQVAGVPPDYFSDDGQLWGNPLYDWDANKASGFQWWVDRLRLAKQMLDLVRIDHFRGFESYWAIPATAETARNGRWEVGPGDAIFDAMREALGHLPIIAEDLGIITDAVEALRRRQNFPGMRVLQFDICDPEFSLEQIGSDRVYYTGTHDNDTSVGWFNGGANDRRSDEDIHWTQQAALHISDGTKESIHIDLIKAVFSTNAQMAIVPMQDFLGLGSDARTNTPGTTEGNWGWRVLEKQLQPDFCDKVASLVTQSRRWRLDGK